MRAASNFPTAYVRIASQTYVLQHIFSISKHKANTTELHPKVRQTCLNLKLMSANNGGGATASEVWRGGGGFQQNISETAHRRHRGENTTERERDLQTDFRVGDKVGPRQGQPPQPCVCVDSSQGCGAVTYSAANRSIGSTTGFHNQTLC